MFLGNKLLKPKWYPNQTIDGLYVTCKRVNIFQVIKFWFRLSCSTQITYEENDCIFRACNAKPRFLINKVKMHCNALRIWIEIFLLKIEMVANKSWNGKLRWAFSFKFICVFSGLDVLALTCPGFPGYCSESFPGQTCVVVCSKGRNNVPLCQVWK
jgi:hypothetical protein